METVITIPDHVIEEILLRLPVKSLLRWKCVSKYWYTLIWDIDFVKKHYLFHNDKHLADHGDVPLLLVSPSGPQPTQFHLLLKDGVRYLVENITAEFERDTSHVFTRVSEMLDYEPRCRGIVNGVVCLQQGPNQVALWNPATREIKDVPVCPTIADYEEAKVYFQIDGFGFDLQSNDFKLLGQIDTWTLDNRRDSTADFHMYSLKANSWKKIQDYPPRTNICLIGSTTDAYFNSGVYYWTAYERGELMRPSRIVSFNFSSEIFKEFELPAFAETSVGSRLRIGKYKEGLALLVQRALGNLQRCFEIWAVTKFRDDDNEVPSSWQLIVKAPPFCIVNCFWMGGMLNCCDILLNILPHSTSAVVEGDGYVPTSGAHIYNPSTHTFYCLGFRLSSGHQYVESLFPISRTP